MDKEIQTFLQAPAFAVVGASNDRSKFGNKVLRCYLQHRLIAYPVNPKEKVIEGLSCYKTLDELPVEVESISIITPPTITKTIIEQAISKGIKNIWLQPGAEHQAAIEQAKKHGMNVIANGACLLVALGFDE